MKLKLNYSAEMMQKQMLLEKNLVFRKIEMYTCVFVLYCYFKAYIN